MARRGILSEENGKKSIEIFEKKCLYLKQFFFVGNRALCITYNRSRKYQKTKWPKTEKITNPKFSKRESGTNPYSHTRTHFSVRSFLLTFASTLSSSFIYCQFTDAKNWQHMCMMILQLLFLKDNHQHIFVSHIFSATLIQLEYSTNFTLVTCVLYASVQTRRISQHFFVRSIQLKHSFSHLCVQAEIKEMWTRVSAYIHLLSTKFNIIIEIILKRSSHFVEKSLRKPPHFLISFLLLDADFSILFLVRHCTFHSVCCVNLAWLTFSQQLFSLTEYFICWVFFSLIYSFAFVSCGNVVLQLLNRDTVKLIKKSINISCI